MCNLVKLTDEDSFKEFLEKLKEILKTIIVDDWIERYDKDTQNTFSKDEKAMSLKEYLSTINNGEMNELPITADFCKEHKQTQKIKNPKCISEKQGYIDNAVFLCVINPNQYWHIYESWKLFFEDNPSKKAKDAYKFLKCPELVLGIAEMTGVDVKLLNIASARAKCLLKNGFCRSCACKKIKEMIPFEKIVEALNTYVDEYNKHNNN